MRPVERYASDCAVKVGALRDQLDLIEDNAARAATPGVVTRSEPIRSCLRHRAIGFAISLLQNLKFNPVEKPCGWQPPQVVGPALL
jgi:hypothetical protein